MFKAPFKGFIKASAPFGSISQYFGDNPSLYDKVCPIADKPLKCLIGHNGIDLVAPWGTPLLAVCDGIIAEVNNSATGYGKHIRLVTNELEITYGHLSEINVVVGQYVKAGDVICKMGNTGFVVSSHDGNGFWKAGSNKYAGTHLHLGVRKVKDNVILNYENGYFGSVDFIDLLPDDGVVDTEEVAREGILVAIKRLSYEIAKKFGVKRLF